MEITKDISPIYSLKPQTKNLLLFIEDKICRKTIKTNKARPFETTVHSQWKSVCAPRYKNMSL
jgi:hypothetical protein